MTDHPPPRLSFDRCEGELHYDGAGWTLRGERDRGWTSLSIGDAEFLHATDDHGAMAFASGEALQSWFPDTGNIGGDLDGRVGSVGDGVYVLRMTPDLDQRRCELYAGFNDPADHKLLIYLGQGVRFVRGLAPDTERTWGEPLVRDASAIDAPLKADAGALVVHRAGPALTVNAACEIGPLPHPDGGTRLGIAIPCKGFAENRIDLAFEPDPRAASFAHQPRFDVTHDRDGQVQGQATRGVQNPTYGPDSNVDFKVRFEWLGDEPFNGRAELRIIHALGEPHFDQTVELKAATGVVEVPFDPRFAMPGVSDVWGRLFDQRGELVWVDRFRMLYDYERFKPDVRPPDDFDAFWRSAMEEMRSRPLEPEFTRVYEDYPDFELYDVSFNALYEHRVHAMLAVPRRRQGPLPAIVGAHPGGVGFQLSKRPDGTYGSKLKRDPRFVQITPLIRGHAPDAEGIPFNHPWWGPLDAPHRHAARYWFTMMARAVDVLAERDDLVDLNRLIAHGGSQGGALALATAALDDRISVCLADSPANCQLHEIVTRYNAFGPSLGQKPPGQSLDQFLHTLHYVDPVNLCPWITCPTYIGCCVGDMTVHSMGPLAAYRNLTALDASQKAFFPGPGPAHANSAEASAFFTQQRDRIAGVPLPDPD